MPSYHHIITYCRMWLLLVLVPVLIEGCGDRYALLPPCDQGYIIQKCERGVNGTVREECIKIQPISAYERWEFWFGLMLFVGVLGKCRWVFIITTTNNVFYVKISKLNL